MASSIKHTPGMRYATARVCANHFPTLDLVTTHAKIITTHRLYSSSILFYPMDTNDILEIPSNSNAIQIQITYFSECNLYSVVQNSETFHFHTLYYALSTSHTCRKLT